MTARSLVVPAAVAVAAALAAVAFANLRGAAPAPTPAAPMIAAHHPPPTEIAREQDEEEGREGREAWIELAHQAGPGVDWRNIEADNVRALIDRRRAGLPRAAGIGAWVERGSENQAGSMYSVVRSTDGADIVAGSAFGGVWRGSADGQGWTPLGDGIYGGVHHLAVLPPDAVGGPDVMITAPTWLDLVYRSSDDGVTWVPVGGLPTDMYGSRRIAVDASGQVWLVVVTDNGSQVMRSTDAGRTFTDVLDLTGIGDLWVPRDGSSDVVYAVSNGEVHRSLDGGDTWDARPGPAFASYDRITGSEATNPPTLYVVTGNGYTGAIRMYRSDDDRASWDSRATITDYYDVVTASIRDPDLVVYGGVEMFRSTNGGSSFSKVNTWDAYYGDPERKLHADIMAVTVAPDAGNGETWYIGCHGGVYTSVDGVNSVRNLSLSGLRVSQYYSTLTDPQDPGRVLAGAQDQGLQWTDRAPAIGAERFDLEQILSGDYGHIVSTEGNTDWTFSVYPGFILTFHDVGNTPVLDFLSYPPDPVIPVWLPFLAPDPLGQDTAFLFAASKLWRFEQVGAQWQMEPLSNQPFNTSPGEFLSAVAFSPVEPSLAVGVTSKGHVWRSTDTGATWQAVGDGPVGSYYYGAAVLPAHRDADVWYLGGSGYDATSVYRSTDGGLTFAPWDDGLPPTLVYGLAEAYDGTDRVFAGTETAAYMRDPSDGEWVEVSGGRAPITQYWTVESLKSENTIRFGTYGRGIWDLQLSPQGEGCWATRDEDGDGVLCESDCDDEAPAIKPGAPERCDGVDSDCDGVAEPDADGDGVFACADADADVVDCDDEEPEAYPGHAEILCDGIDNDCQNGDACPQAPTVPPPDGGCGCATGTSAPLLAWGAVAGVAAVGLRSLRSRRSRRRPSRS